MTALTIGMFDGVHRGHQLLLQKLVKIGCNTTALTFSNHPSSILRLQAPNLLTPYPLKEILLRNYGVQQLICLPFTKEFSQQSYDEFLSPYSISHLILGEDAALGRDRQGTIDALKLLGLKRGFEVHSISKLFIDNEPISSTRIRGLIELGKLAEAEELLGRPHCFFTTDHHPILPPDGTYSVWSYSPSGELPTTLRIRNRIPEPPHAASQLVCFGPKKLNPQLIKQLWQISLAAL
jgi:riboflavin kinase/FMN adenylyltransferase